MFESLGLLITLYGAYRIVQRYRARDSDGKRDWLRRLATTAVTAVAEVQAGRQVKVTGRVRLAGDPFVTPVGAERCAIYEASVHEGGDGSGAKLARAAQRSDFFVEDGGGKLLVRAESALLLLYPTCLRQATRWNKVDEKVELFIQQKGGKAGATGPLLYTEAALRDGDFVQVIGMATEELDPTASGPHTHREPARRVTLVAAPGTELLVSSYSPHVIRIFQLPDRDVDQGALDALTGSATKSADQSGTGSRS